MPAVAPETPKDDSMEMRPADNLENPADIGDGDLHMADMGDTTDFYKEVDEADESMDGFSPAEIDDSDDHEMIALMDILRTLGVWPEEANRFSAKIMRISA